MDKQIEELEDLKKIIRKSFEENENQKPNSEDLALDILNAGYRKIPENAVVLTREEYEKQKAEIERLTKLAELRKKDNEDTCKLLLEMEDKCERLEKSSENVCKKSGELLDENLKFKQGQIELQKQVEELRQENNILYISNKLQEEQAIKETAEKFAERVKMAFYYEFEELIPSIMADKIDEICKEITEKGVQNGN